MIVPDENAPLRKGNASTPPQQALEAEPAPPPPAYNDYQSTSRYIPIPTEDSLLPREPAHRRFIKAFLVAVLIWALIGIFISSFIDVVTGRHRRWDGDIDDCVLWVSASDRAHPRLREFNFHSGVWSQAQFTLPANADALFLVSRGDLAAGELYVTESNKATDVTVQVFVHHSDAEALSRASSCKLSRRGGQKGIGIFTPTTWRGRFPPYEKDRLRFLITVELPSKRNAIRSYPAFGAELPKFAVHIEDLSALRFGGVSLQSTNSPIEIAGLVAKELLVRATNGAISGVFNTSDSLTLETTNAPVSVSIGAKNDDKGKTTKVSVKSTNGHIEADLSLVSTSKSRTGGSFDVHARTTNQHIEVVYHESPVNSVLNFDASSTNSPVRALLDPAYEGTFSTETTNAAPVLDRSRVEDPSGLGRRRSVVVTRLAKTKMQGNVKWVPESSRSHSGSAKLETTNDQVSLTV
ncbi:hypothetical protein BC834DRAFT_830545 [Gloeopeniophorella convolvens]|nr:hypothetical protein BC834DRAFT_830545 [Gloeopeniophorella convolvens]